MTQTMYAKELIDLARLTNSKLEHTPMEVNAKYHKDFGDPISDPTLYQKLVHSLIYLTTTHPDISYAGNIVNQFMSDPRHHHLVVVFCILRYLRGTVVCFSHPHLHFI